MNSSKNRAKRMQKGIIAFSSLALIFLSLLFLSKENSLAQVTNCNFNNIGGDGKISINSNCQITKGGFDFAFSGPMVNADLSIKTGGVISIGKGASLVLPPGKKIFVDGGQILISKNDDGTSGAQGVGALLRGSLYLPDTDNDGYPDSNVFVYDTGTSNTITDNGNTFVIATEENFNINPAISEAIVDCAPDDPDVFEPRACVWSEKTYGNPTNVGSCNDFLTGYQKTETTWTRSILVAEACDGGACIGGENGVDVDWVTCGVCRPGQIDYCGTGACTNSVVCNQYSEYPTCNPIAAPTWYRNIDGDVYGNPGGPTLVQCTQPVGYVSNNYDCDDNNASTGNTGLRTRWLSSSVACNSSCTSQNQTCSNGSWTGTYTATGCSVTSCPAGQFCNGGTCTSCTAGYRCPGDNSRVLCAIGTYSTGGASTCTSCSTGYCCSTGSTSSTANSGSTWYRDADGDGYGNPSITTFACTQPSGYVANNNDCNDSSASVYQGTKRTRYACGTVGCGTANYTEEQTCQAGGTWSGTYTLTSPCSSVTTRIRYSSSSSCSSASCTNETQYCQSNNTWSPNTLTSTSCTANTCPAGQFCNGGTCTSCTAGYRCPGDNSRVLCAIGTYSTGGASTCTSCSTGYCCSTGSTSSTANSGSTWYRDADGDGYGNPSITTFACTQPSGYVANNNDCNDSSASVYQGTKRTRYACGTVGCGTANYTEEQTCQAGGTWSGTYTLTSPCSNVASRVRHSISSSCTSASCSSETQYCQSNNTWSPNNYSATSCVVNTCAAGTYCSNGTCSNCGTGHYCTGGSARAACPAGRYGSTANLTSSTCTGACTAGYYCPAGSTSATQNACATGTYSAAGAGSCTSCPAGTYNTGTANTSCPNCLGSTVDGFSYGNLTNGSSQTVTKTACYRTDGGQLSVTFSCSNGSVSQSGSTSVPNCFSGYLYRFGSWYQDTQGCFDVCVLATCSAGSVNVAYTNLSGLSSGTITFYNSQMNHGNTTTFTRDLGSYTCSANFSCTDGSVSFVAGTGTCSCKSGYTGTAPSCTLTCNGGYYASSGSCVAVGLGYYSPASDSQRYPCPAGTYCPTTTNVSGTNCPAGTYRSSTRATALSNCLNCSSGSYSSAGSSSCAPCATGYTSTAGSSSCKTCAGGYYSTNYGVSCAAVGPGYYSPANNYQRYKCAGGRYGNTSYNTASTCNGACNAGYYCPAGSTSANANSCPSGSYCASGSASPSNCRTGTLNPYTNQTSSSACRLPQGDYWLSGTQSCKTPCPGQKTNGGYVYCLNNHSDQPYSCQTYCYGTSGTGCVYSY